MQNKGQERVKSRWPTQCWLHPGQTEHLWHCQGRDGGMANAGQHNASFGQASMGQQALPKQQTITFVPAMLKHLAPQKAEKSGLGRTRRVSSPSGFSYLKAPPRFSTSGADPWMVNGNLMVAGSFHSTTFCQRAPRLQQTTSPKPLLLTIPLSLPLLPPLSKPNRD